MHLNFTHRTQLVLFKVLYDACLAERVQTFNDGGRINEVAIA